MKLAIDQDSGEFFVWAMLDDPNFNGDPRDRGESFLIGTGATPDEAIDAAIRDLKQAWEQAEALRDDGHQPPSGLRGDPAAPRTVNGDARGSSSSTKD